MHRRIRSHRFGPYCVDVVEIHDDEGPAGYLLVIDGSVVNPDPLPTAPTEDDVVRAYARWREGR